METKYDILIIGAISLDCNIDYMGTEINEIGGAIVASGFAAANSSCKTALFTKCNSSDVNPQVFFKNLKADLFWDESINTTRIENRYLSADQERRECKCRGKCDSFELSEFSDINAYIYYFAGLMAGDFNPEDFVKLHKKSKVAVDMQSILRYVEKDNSMRFYDWDDKLKYLPNIDYLKADAAEAEILTGYIDRKKAAEQLFKWGAKEVMITHNTEVLIFDGSNFYTCPLKPRNLSGRSGRGDTCFAGYLSQRINNNISSSLIYAAAIVSLKMESPGPFCETRVDVENYIKLFYTPSDLKMECL